MSEKELQITPEQKHFLSEGIDFYKLTMGQVALEQFTDTEVTFSFKNRDAEYPISEYVSAEALKSRLDKIRNQGFTPEEIAYFAGIEAQDLNKRFDEPYLNFLSNIKLPEVSIKQNAKTSELEIQTTGDWAAVSLWETVIMSEANEEYYRQKLFADGIDINSVLENGDQLLSQKIEILKKRPDIKFADFGTRRRFSADWQDHVVGRLASEIPNNFIGTSNPWLAYKYEVNPIGTYAHEMPMVYAALSDKNGNKPIDGHSAMMNDWFDRYGKDLSIALTDTFTSDLFFAEFTPEQANSWNGVRHDSGDALEFGQRVIDYYKSLNIDPLSKTLIFSDGLDLDKIIELADRFNHQINVVFGWGTTLTNDLGIRPNNIVMKATKANQVNTVKLSDSTGKYTGPDEKIAYYIDDKDQRIANRLNLQKAI